MRQLLLLLCLYAFPVLAQKTVMKYPLRFHETLIYRGTYVSYLLPDAQEKRAVLALKDYTQAQYVLLDENFKVIDTINQDVKGTILKSMIDAYIGGTNNGNVYRFISIDHSVSMSKDIRKYRLQTVDFDKKEVTKGPLFDVDKNEKFITSFNQDNVFYAVTANDNTSELLFHQIDGKGIISTNKVSVRVPENAGKKRNQLSEYLAGAKVIKPNTEPDFSQIVCLTKLFIQSGKFHFVVNEGDHSTHVITVNLPDFSVQEKFYHYQDALSPEGGRTVFVNAYLKDNRLFSLILNKKNIRLVIFNLDNEQIQSNIELNEDNYLKLIAQPAIAQTRRGKKESEKEINSFHSLIKVLTKGTEGLMVTTTKTGQFVITIGTYDFLTVPVGSSSGHYGTNPTGPGARSVGSPTLEYHYTPGETIYATNLATYYKATRFGLLLDPVTCKPKKGRVPVPVSDQVKDFVETMQDNKAYATYQFCIRDKQYLGFYDRNAKAYLISQIRIAK